MQTKFINNKNTNQSNLEQINEFVRNPTIKKHLPIFVYISFGIFSVSLITLIIYVGVF
jgi:hypothetical protein